MSDAVIKRMQPDYGEEERNAILRVFDSGMYVKGPESKALEQEICDFTGFSLSMVNRLIADPSKTPRDKSRNIRVFRIQEPVEAAEKIEPQAAQMVESTD